jgi:hypothetical protein
MRAMFLGMFGLLMASAAHAGPEPVPCGLRKHSDDAACQVPVDWLELLKRDAKTRHLFDGLRSFDPEGLPAPLLGCVAFCDVRLESWTSFCRGASRDANPPAIPRKSGDRTLCQTVGEDAYGGCLTLCRAEASGGRPLS